MEGHARCDVWKRASFMYLPACSHRCCPICNAHCRQVTVPAARGAEGLRGARGLRSGPGGAAADTGADPGGARGPHGAAPATAWTALYFRFDDISQLEGMHACGLCLSSWAIETVMCSKPSGACLC